MTNLEYNITNPYTEKEIEEFEEWKVKSEYVIGQKKMGEEYKSITQWLKTMPNKDLERWRKNVGEEVADYIMKQGAERGTAVHEMIRRYLELPYQTRRSEFSAEHGSFGEIPYEYRTKHCLHDGLFMNMLHDLQAIKDVFLLEDWLYSDKYKIFGKVDCIGQFYGYYAVIDFKTKRTRREKMTTEEGIQLTAYALMFNEMFKKDIKDIVVVGASEDGGMWTIRKEIKFYKPLLEDLINYERKDS